MPGSTGPGPPGIGPAVNSNLPVGPCKEPGRVARRRGGGPCHCQSGGAGAGPAQRLPLAAAPALPEGSPPLAQRATVRPLGQLNGAPAEAPAAGPPGPAGARPPPLSGGSPSAEAPIAERAFAAGFIEERANVAMCFDI